MVIACFTDADMGKKLQLAPETNNQRWRSGHLVPDVDLRLPGRRSLLLSVTPND
jgi:hypothetical protein